MMLYSTHPDLKLEFRGISENLAVSVYSVGGMLGYVHLVDSWIHTMFSLGSLPLPIASLK